MKISCISESVIVVWKAALVVRHVCCPSCCSASNDPKKLCGRTQFFTRLERGEWAISEFPRASVSKRVLSL